MKPTATILCRFLTGALAILPPLAGADVCTVGALAGRAELMCGMEQATSVCHAEAALPSCPLCARAAPAPQPVRPLGSTCCDLRPQATGASEAPVLGAPVPASYPAATVASFASVCLVPSAAHVAADISRAPPGNPPPPLSSRAPPLA